MRIALVTGSAVPSPVVRSSGTSAPAAVSEPQIQGLRVAALARTLAGLGHQVTIYARKDSPARPRTSAAGGVMIEYLPAGPAAPLPEDKLLAQMGNFGAALAQCWQRRPPDVVHAHFWTSGLAALAAARELPMPVVQTFHSLGPPAAGRPRPAGRDVAGGPGRAGGQLPVRPRFEALIARSVKTVLAGSTRELSALARMGVPRTSIRLVPAGVDVCAFGPAGPVARRGKRPRLLAVSALEAGHGLGTAVEALARVPAAELVVAGGPPRAELAADPVLQDLVRLAQRLEVSDRLMFTGKVTGARMAALLRSADLYVHVALDEPVGLLPLEAMACGTPVVAWAGGSDQDAVVDGATGVLVPPGDPGALARRIRQLLASPMLLQGFGIAAADRVRTRYSWERVGAETLAAYESSCQPAGQWAAGPGG
jgi:glycosyltransferase involved in cell wall biosynthesis